VPSGIRPEWIVGELERIRRLRAEVETCLRERQRAAAMKEGAGNAAA
jgi:hypothetical protein